MWLLYCVSRPENGKSRTTGLRSRAAFSAPQSKHLGGELKFYTSCSPITRRSRLGQYLIDLAAVADAIDYEGDERLLRHYLHNDPPLHIRRTLDQYYFLTLEDTSARDRDQVVYRETKAGRRFQSRNTRVVMVDQLWLWILDDSKIPLQVGIRE
jgi:hypothetical protein